MGSKWTFDWLSYIKDNPNSPLADVEYYIMGGGTRDFTGFDANSRTYAFQLFDQTKLTRISTSPIAYEMLSRDGTRKIFAQSNAATGSERKVFLTKLVDPFGNSVSLSYDEHMRIVEITDAIGQTTQILYQNTDIYKITMVTDPFGRSAKFEYEPDNPLHRLWKITDPEGIWSQFEYDAGDFITSSHDSLWSDQFLQS